MPLNVNKTISTFFDIKTAPPAVETWVKNETEGGIRNIIKRIFHRNDSSQAVAALLTEKHISVGLSPQEAKNIRQAYEKFLHDCAKDVKEQQILDGLDQTILDNLKITVGGNLTLKEKVHFVNYVHSQQGQLSFFEKIRYFVSEFFEKKRGDSKSPTSSKTVSYIDEATGRTYSYLYTSP